MTTTQVLEVISATLKEEAECCNEYARDTLKGRGQQADHLYIRSGMLFSLSTCFERAADRISFDDKTESKGSAE